MLREMINVLLIAGESQCWVCRCEKRTLTLGGGDARGVVKIASLKPWTCAYLSATMQHPAHTLAASSTCSGRTRNLTRLKSWSISGRWRPKCIQAVLAIDISMNEGLVIIEGEEYGQTQSSRIAWIVRWECGVLEIFSHINLSSGARRPA